MKIILVAPKTLKTPKTFDYAFWNFYIPLLELGHQIHFFDTTNFGNLELNNLINKFKPDLLFGIMTGNVNLCPDEPWETIQTETIKGNVNTFNWFCDDSYRFDSFSKNVCKYFNYCSTPEKKYLENYKNIGYTNIVYSTWHVNFDLYNTYKSNQKEYDVCFIGGMNNDRLQYIKKLTENKINIVVSKLALPFETMLDTLAKSKICLNFSKDATGSQTQMKARMFEIPATGSMLLTEYTDDLENCFNNDEILYFKNCDELINKINLIKNNYNEFEIVSNKTIQKVKHVHDSKIRLKNLLEEIFQ